MVVLMVVATVGAVCGGRGRQRETIAVNPY